MSREHLQSIWERLTASEREAALAEDRAARESEEAEALAQAHAEVAAECALLGIATKSAA